MNKRPSIIQLNALMTLFSWSGDFDKFETTLENDTLTVTGFKTIAGINHKWSRSFTRDQLSKMSMPMSEYIADNLRKEAKVAEAIQG